MTTTNPNSCREKWQIHLSAQGFLSSKEHGNKSWPTHFVWVCSETISFQGTNQPIQLIFLQLEMVCMTEVWGFEASQQAKSICWFKVMQLTQADLGIIRNPAFANSGCCPCSSLCHAMSGLLEWHVLMGLLFLRVVVLQAQVLLEQSPVRGAQDVKWKVT